MMLPVVCILTAFKIVQIFSFQAVTIPQKLPNPADGIRALYLGNDDILLVGGKTGGLGPIDFFDYVLRFSLTSEEIQLVGQFPYGISDGSAYAIPRSDNALYLGGWNNDTPWIDSSIIWSINGSSNNNVNPLPIGNLPIENFYSVSAYDGEDTIYIFGGFNNAAQYDIVKYSIQTNTAITIETMLPNIIHGGSSTWYNNSAYIFGGIFTAYQVLRFIPSSEGNKLEVLDIRIPQGFIGGNAITIGQYIYLVDGFAEGDNMTMLIFDPRTGNFTAHTISNLLRSWDAASVYVPKLNRIYISGGYDVALDKSYDLIHYINL